MKLYFHLIISIDTAEKHFPEELNNFYFATYGKKGSFSMAGGGKSPTNSSLFLIFLCKPKHHKKRSGESDRRKTIKTFSEKLPAKVKHTNN